MQTPPPQTPKILEEVDTNPKARENLKFYFEFCLRYFTSESGLQ